MTVLAPEFLQTTKYSAQRMRQMQAAAGGPLQEGIVNYADFRVAQRGAGANMSVDIAAGDAWVQGDNTARQGMYHVGNDATVNVAVPAAHATNPRVDQVVLRIYDSTVIGGEKDLAAIEVVAGTATAGASLSNRTGAAALPASAIKLADVLVPGAATKIETAQIGNLRDPRAGLSGYPAAVAPLSVATAPPQYAMGRPMGFVPAVLASRTTPVGVGTGVPTAVPLNSADTYDTEAMHDPVTNNTRINIGTPGFYNLNAAVSWSFPILHVLSFRVSGATAIFFNETNAVSASTAGILRLNAGDYVELLVQQASGVERTVTAFMGAAWVGP